MIVQSLNPPYRAEPMNHSEIGRRLRAVARTLLPYIVEKHGHGFQDGGCHMLAEALVRWSGGSLKLAAVHSNKPPRDPRAVQHVVACYADRLYLDSDGMATAKELASKMTRLEFLEGAFVRNSMVPGPRHRIPFDEGTVVELASRLEQRMGPFAGWIGELEEYAGRVPAHVEPEQAGAAAVPTPYQGKLDVYVKVAGDYSEPEDEDVAGIYLIKVDGALTERQRAAAALDAFDMKMEIEQPLDFEIMVHDHEGRAIEPAQDHVKFSLFDRALYLGPVDALPGQPSAAAAGYGHAGEETERDFTAACG